MWTSNFIVMFYLLNVPYNVGSTNKRQKRYLLFTKDTQWGVFATVSVPLHPETLVSVAWFFEANYYNVDNSSYFDPLLGDIETSRSQRDLHNRNQFTRHHIYTTIESMLERHNYPARPCLLRAICESTASNFIHDGVLGDLLHFILTPSTSISEDDIEDDFYEAEYRGLEQHCGEYIDECPNNPIDLFTVIVEQYITF